MDWIKIISRWVFTNFLLAILLLSFFGISSSFAFFFLKDKLKWERYDFGDKTQEEKAKIVENIISSAINDSIVAKLQSVKLSQCTLTIETKYLRPCNPPAVRGDTIYSTRIVDLTELSDDNVSIVDPSEYYRDTSIIWNYRYEIAAAMSQIDFEIGQALNKQTISELETTGSSVGSPERAAKYAKIREAELNRLGIKSRTINQVCDAGTQVSNRFARIRFNVKPSQAKVALSSLATYKLEYCSAK